jgi:biopolymer transport protein ExbD
MYTPGVHVQLPMANDLPGTDKPSVAVAIDGHGRLYYDNAPIGENALKNELGGQIRKAAGKPLVLIVHADQDVPYKMLLGLTLIARDAGISEVLFATLPNPAMPPKTR